MKKTINLIHLSIILVFTGCGNDSLDQSNTVIDVEQEVSAKYLLIMDDGFESEKTSYAEGDKVKDYLIPLKLRIFVRFNGVKLLSVE